MYKGKLALKNFASNIRFGFLSLKNITLILVHKEQLFWRDFKSQYDMGLKLCSKLTK